MGYCPRCGENSPYGESEQDANWRVGELRIPAASRIVHIPDAAEGSVVSYGGSRFRVHRREGSVYLELVA